MLTIGALVSAVNFFVFGTTSPDSESNYLVTIIIWSLAWGMGGAFISLFMSKYLAKTGMGVQIIHPQQSSSQEREILNMVHSLSRKAGLSKMPEVGIYNSPDINAFATGPSRNNSLVAVSTGLLNSMNRDQVEGVLGHEVAHIANGDMVTMTLLQGVINAFVLFFARIVANVVANQLSNDDRGPNYFVYFAIYMFFQAVFGFLGMLVVGYFSRLREFRADRGGAEYAGRHKMIAALQALQQQPAFAQRPGKKNEKDSFASLKISNGKKPSLMSLISTHPPLNRRIERLQRRPT